MKSKGELLGLRFSRLLVLEKVEGGKKKNRHYYRCLCDCGNEVVVERGSLMCNNTRSCGCLRTKVLEMIGRRFGRLEVISVDSKNKQKCLIYLCKCECGNLHKVSSGNLRQGVIKSCGCLVHSEELSKTKIKDYTGHIFGKLKVIKFAEMRKHQSYFSCLCECGKTVIVKASNLISKQTQSCGCLRRKARTHGLTVNKQISRCYRVWCSMRLRCSGSSPNYGGRGIKICDRWQSFELFYLDMGDVPKGMSIDRIDVNGDYSPENCKWASKVEQANNKRNNVLITHNQETRTVTEWSRITGIHSGTIRGRLKNGWEPTKAITTPLIHPNRNHNNKPNKVKKAPEYGPWCSMKQRCNNKNCVMFYRYGGRGISYCVEWELFSNFLRDMGPRPNNTSLDRINPDGNYCPSNCRWATIKTQSTNKSKKVY